MCPDMDLLQVHGHDAEHERDRMSPVFLQACYTCCPWHGTSLQHAVTITRDMVPGTPVFIVAQRFASVRQRVTQNYCVLQEHLNSLFHYLQQPVVVL